MTFIQRRSGVDFLSKFQKTVSSGILHLIFGVNFPRDFWGKFILSDRKFILSEPKVFFVGSKSFFCRIKSLFCRILKFFLSDPKVFFVGKFRQKSNVEKKVPTK